MFQTLILVFGVTLFRFSQSETWTPWYDRDNPSGTGDHETISVILSENPTTMCEDPVAIECQTIAGQPYTSTGEVVTCSLSIGLTCRLSENGNSCTDYRVRFLCPDDTILYNHHCYKFESTATTWNDARELCESFSSQLITINTEEELAYFTAIGHTYDPFPKIWTGMNDIAEEGHPVWLTHEQPTYNEFKDNDDPNNMDCFRIGNAGKNRYDSCNEEFGYVCEASSNIYERYSIAARKKSPAAGHVVSCMLAVSSGACSMECSKLESCVSFSYNSSTNDCILSSSSGQSAELEDVENANFYVVTSTAEICKSFT
ncbi:neurocan core protein-like isoform X2 [Anneissia japonica]|uniref:neurocan core protein-like isoform X2 n=1 Tax=Anneissia japonica TaxID=1529436 RepID=UPI0014256F56|nr:neurocan core protein-like isoform X2 [Anneissia japonica]